MAKCRLTFLLAILFLSSACQHTQDPYVEAEVNHTGQAGTLMVSVNAAVPWTTLESELSPNFKMSSGDDALTKVVQSTATINSQIIEAFGLGLAAGLPQLSKTTSDTIVNTTTDGVTTTTETSSIAKERKPGEVPTVPGIAPPDGSTVGNEDASTPATTGDSASAPSPPPTPGIDAQTQYKAARSLYQSVKLLNSEIEHVALRKGYVPQILMLKLTNIIYQRNLPYDTHATVSFFNSTNNSSSTRLPYVFPILATDNLERAIVNNSAQLSSQIGLALSGMISNVGLGVNAQNQSSQLNAITANEINSLMTVGRMTDNSIYVRIGAANQASSRFSMVGQTYDVAVLLLVPEEYYTVGPEVRIGVVSQHKFMHARNGKELANIPFKDYEDKLDSILERYTYKGLKESWLNATRKRKMEHVGRVYNSITSNVFDENVKTAIANLMIDCCVDYFVSTGTQQAIWTQIANLNANSSVKSASIEIRRLPLLNVPPQGAVLRDFGDAGAQIVLHGVSGVTKSNINPLLIFCPTPLPSVEKSIYLKQDAASAVCENPQFELPPSDYSFERTKGLLTLVFPPLKPFDLNYKNAALRFPPLECQYRNACESRERNMLPAKSCIFAKQSRGA